MGDRGHDLVPLLKKFYESRQPLGAGAHKVMMDSFRRYMLVEGMPEAVKEYAVSKDLRKVEKRKRDILAVYRTDLARSSTEMGTDLSGMFAGIPSQLNRKDREFDVRPFGMKAKGREAMEALLWMEDSKAVNLCYNATDPDDGLMLYRGEVHCKMYMADTGLLITHAISELGMDMDSVYADLFMDRLSLNEGMFVENLVCQMLNASGHRLFYYSRSSPNDRRNDIEVDFLVMRNGRICPVEVKSASSTKHVSLDKFRDRFGKLIGQPFILCTKDVARRTA